MKAYHVQQSVISMLQRTPVPQEISVYPTTIVIEL